MPRYVDCVLILSEPLAADGVVSRLRDLLAAGGLLFAPDSDVVFNDVEGSEREPEVAATEAEALGKIREWPGLGGTDYLFSGQRVSIFLSGARPGQVDAVSLSINSSPYSRDAQVRRAYDELVGVLHVAMKAARTFCGYELLSPSGWVSEEVERVRRGVFEGRYEIDLHG